MVSWSNILQRIFAHFNMRHPMSPAVTVNIDQINYSLLWLMKKTKMTYPWLWCRGRLHPVHISLKYQGLLNSHNYVLPLIRSLYIDGISMCYQYLSGMQKHMLVINKGIAKKYASHKTGLKLQTILFETRFLYLRCD